MPAGDDATRWIRHDAGWMSYRLLGPAVVFAAWAAALACQRAVAAAAPARAARIRIRSPCKDEYGALGLGDAADQLNLTD